MRVKLDDNLPDSAIETLGHVGYDVDTARAEGLRGANDPTVRPELTSRQPVPRHRVLTKDGAKVLKDGGA